MREVSYEECAMPKNEKTQKVFIIIFSVLFWVSVVLAFIILLFAFNIDIKMSVPFFILTAFLILSAVLLKLIIKRFNVSYDYIFVTGSVRISKVVNNNSRKNLCIFDCSDVTTVGRYYSETYNTILRSNSIKPKIYIANTQKDISEYFYIYTKDKGVPCMYVIECTEKFINHILMFTGNLVLEKDFNKNDIS